MSNEENQEEEEASTATTEGNDAEGSESVSDTVSEETDTVE